MNKSESLYEESIFVKTKTRLKVKLNTKLNTKLMTFVEAVQLADK
jgi:hypothetical protein